MINIEDALIDINDNVYSFANIKKDVEKQAERLELLQTSLTSELTESNSEIDEIKKNIKQIEERIDKLCTVLVNHASIIKNIRTAITLTE